MFLNKGSYNGKQILGKKTAELAHINQNSHILDSSHEYGSSIGLVFGLTSEKVQALGGKGSTGTFYWGGYFNTYFFADPVEELIGIIYMQTQGDNSFLISNKFKSSVFQSLIN